MIDNHKVDFAKKKGLSDEWYTPTSAIYSILKHIDKTKVIWCPFDTEESNFVKVLLTEGYKVVYSHISLEGDFFKYEPDLWDIMFSNPPYSIRNDILTRAFSFDKPFALLMNTNGLFDSKLRWEY